MRLADYVWRRLSEHGVTDVFLVSGGGIMHLLDGVGLNRNLRYFCTYHEQAAVIAAEGFARRNGRLGVALVTVGPGAANAASALPGAWVDSIPLLVIAGQVRRDLIADYERLRQFGPQEANTLAMVRPVTKYAASVCIPSAIREHIDDAVEAALSGRPGPVWIEIPLDVQGANIEEHSLPQPVAQAESSANVRLKADAKRVLELLRRARRPLFIPGNGLRASAALDSFNNLLSETRIPVITAFTGKDLVAEDHPNYVGVFGTAGQRRANFALQNSDLLLTLGAGLNVQKCGFNIGGFAPRATKIIVELDFHQLHEQAIKPDLAIQADVGRFINALLVECRAKPLSAKLDWLALCTDWKRRYSPVSSDASVDGTFVDSYDFMDALSAATCETDTIVTGNGLDAVSASQAYRVTAGQRFLITGWGSMGWDLPLAVGACIGYERKRVIVVTGDGSIMWNIAELQTISRYSLPIKIFIFNNAGYSSIRATQDTFFDGRYVGADRNSGVMNPDFKQLAAAFGLPYADKLGGGDNVLNRIKHFLSDDQAGICEVMISPSQGIAPKASAFRLPDGTFESRPLEDMAPFLPSEEVVENMRCFDDDLAAR